MNFSFSLFLNFRFRLGYPSCVTRKKIGSRTPGSEKPVLRPQDFTRPVYLRSTRKRVYLYCTCSSFEVSRFGFAVSYLNSFCREWSFVFPLDIFVLPWISSLVYFVVTFVLSWHFTFIRGDSTIVSTRKYGRRRRILDHKGQENIASRLHFVGIHHREERENSGNWKGSRYDLSDIKSEGT